MKKRYYILALLCFVQVSYGQLKKADRIYDSGDYKTAAQLYQEIWDNDKDKQVLEKLIHCYYNTYSFERTLVAISSLVNGAFKNEDKYYDNSYNFMYYQFLSATGDYEKAIDYLVLYKETRGLLPPDKNEAKEEVETFRLKDADYTITKEEFNSTASDFGAVKHNESIYFSSDRGNTSKLKYNWTHRSFLDIYKYELGEKKSPSAMSKIINSELHEGSFCFSKDGNTLYLSRSNAKNGKAIFDNNKNNNVQLYVAHKKNGKWKEPIKLPFNSDEYTYEHPALDPEEKRLYFSSNMLGSLGSYDLYYVTINDDGTYGSPKNLGYKINTENREQFPFISKEGHLFFASNGHLGLGMLDVFVSEKINEKFTRPINLGSPVNSRYDDFSMRYYDSKNGFFTSNRDHINDDIYAFKQVGEIFTAEFVNQFEIRDKTTKAYVANASVNLMHGDSTIYENILDEEALFNSNLRPGTYQLKASALGYENGFMAVNISKEKHKRHVLYLTKNSQIVDIINNQSESSKEVIGKLLKDKEPPKIFTKDDKLYFDMPPIYFDFDRWELREDSKYVLDLFAKKLTKYPSLHIRISAHTDTRGTDQYNQILSEKRAQATRNYLSKIGNIATKRISFKGYGESKPIINCNNCTEAEHQKNRRSDFELLVY